MIDIKLSAQVSKMVLNIKRVSQTTFFEAVLRHPFLKIN